MRRMLPIAFFAVLVFITAPRCAAQDHAESSRKLVARAVPRLDEAKGWLRQEGTNLHRYGADISSSA